MEKSFKEYLKNMIKYYNRKDLHISDTDTLSDKRLKDINFGKLQAYEEILRKWNEENK